MDYTLDDVFYHLALLKYNQVETEAIENLKEIVVTIDKRRWKILKLKYIEQQSLQKVADHFNISRERIRQIITETKRRLNHPLRKQKIWNDVVLPLVLQKTPKLKPLPTKKQREIENRFGKPIDEILKSNASLTYKEASEKLGLSPGTIAKWYKARNISKPINKIRRRKQQSRDNSAFQTAEYRKQKSNDAKRRWKIRKKTGRHIIGR